MSISIGENAQFSKKCRIECSFSRESNPSFIQANLCEGYENLKHRNTD